MIKIVFVITGLEVGGAEAMLIKVLSLLDRSRFDPTVVSLRSGGPLAGQVIGLGVRLVEMGISSTRMVPSATLKLRNLARQIRPDCVQGWMYHGNLAACIMARSLGRKVPLLWSIRVTADSRTHEKRLTRSIVKLGAKLSRRPRAIIYNSARSESQHRSLGYAGQRSVVIPNGFDTDKFLPSPEARKETRKRFGIGEEPVVGIVGRFHPIKDHGTFLEAAQKVREQIPNARFLIVGRGLEPTNRCIVEQIEELGLNECCILAGNQSEMQRIYPALDVLVSSSISEGFPNVLGEAMSCGVPCVATDVGDSAVVIGPTGIVVPPRDPSKLAAAIVTLLKEDAPSRKRRSEFARSRVIECYSLDSIVAEYETIFEQHALERSR